ncbi:MAG TPA: response regulator [Candidatus Angelobacter sp.]
MLDYDMPNMKGTELAHRIKEHKCDVPIILFSGDPSLPASALNVVDGHVAKGEGWESLLQALKKFTF